MDYPEELLIARYNSFEEARACPSWGTPLKEGWSRGAHSRSVLRGGMVITWWEVKEYGPPTTP